MASSNNPSTSDPAPPTTASRNNDGVFFPDEITTEDEVFTTDQIIMEGGEYHQISIVDILRKRIWKVPPLLRSHPNNKGKFDPRVVSIGPYHHGKPELQPAEAIKPLVVQLFLDDPHCLRGGEDINKSIISYDDIRLLVPNSLREDINSSINYGDIHQLVKARVRYARSCYDEGSTDSYSDDKFTEMMILDGFFVLAALLSFDSDVGFNILVCSSLGQHTRIWLVKDVTHLVENQIPFPILELLMKSIFKDPEKGMQIISTYFSSPSKGDWKASHIEARSPIHLMEVHWWCEYGFHHLHVKTESRGRMVTGSPYYFSSVSELKDMGINVAPSTGTCPGAVTFKSGFLSGRLQLPPYMVSDEKDRKDANLMAYEFSSPHLRRLPATAYINFMKSIINHPEDVRELRSKYVLFAPGLSDERVLEIVHETATFEIDDPRVYNHVRQGIHDHCNRKWNKWMAELINSYFRNPWTFMALMAATFLLVMTFIQTYFAVKH